jgi:glycosyltransferase involved in cell wall biosynthesis
VEPSTSGAADAAVDAAPTSTHVAAVRARTREPLRILTVATRLDAIGGLERAQLQACTELRHRGHEIDLLYTQPGDLLPSWEGIASRRGRVDGYSLYRGAPLTSTLAVLAAVVAGRRFSPDAVYFHHHRHALMPALAGRPSVCHLHLPPPPTRSRQDAFALARVTRFVAVSDFTAGQWSEHLRRPRQDFTVVHNGVDLDRFSPAGEAQRHSVRAALGLPDDRFLILYAARITTDKGVDLALESMRRLPAADYHLAVAGEPNPADFGGDVEAGRAYEQELRRRFAEVPVTWLGRLTEMSALLASVDAVILPSRFPDPLPLLVLETLASGTPIVASAVGGIPEMLRGELARNLTPTGDVEALAERIRALRDWRVQRPELARLGREMVERDYTLERMGDGIAAVLESAVAGTEGEPVASRSTPRALP